MKIVVLAEGSTEVVFRETLKDFQHKQYNLAGQEQERIGIVFRNYRGMIPIGEELRERVKSELSKKDTLSVIALSDVYPQFESAAEAKRVMIESVPNENRFFAHAAQYDFEAWLLPFWKKIMKRIGRTDAPLTNNPETLNDDNPPAHRLKNLYKASKSNVKNYSKPIEASAILRGEDLTIAANQCPELKAFLNTILRLSNLPELP